MGKTEAVLAAGLLALSSTFATNAQSPGTGEVTLAWNPSTTAPGVELCAYALYSRQAPGFLSDSDTQGVLVPPNATTATVTVPEGMTSVFAVTAVGSMPGVSCANTADNMKPRSGSSNFVAVWKDGDKPLGLDGTHAFPADCPQHGNVEIAAFFEGLQAGSAKLAFEYRQAANIRQQVRQICAEITKFKTAPTPPSA